MWIVDLLQLKETPYQFFIAGGIGIALAIYAMFVPKCEINKDAPSQSFVSRLGLDAFKLFKEYKMAAFFIFSMLLGVALQITNSYANPYITSFGKYTNEKGEKIYEHTLGVRYAGILISLSQISECFCILLIPFFLKRYGIKIVMLIAMVAWVFRFFFFGIGNPGLSGVWLFVLSCIVYGVAFDFFNVSGSLFVNKETDENIRSSAQGLFMLMTNGIGSIIGTYGAQAIINHNVYDESVKEPIAGWRKSWYIFSAYAAVIAVLFVFLFRYNHKDELKSEEKKNAEEIELGKVEN
jgi:NHS family xanthosine MFS transporter